MYFVHILFLLFRVFISCFYFYFLFLLEIRNYKVDLVSLLSVDLITGSTVIPFIPHIEGRQQDNSPLPLTNKIKTITSNLSRINQWFCPKLPFLCFRIVKTRPIYYFLRRHSKVLCHILCFNLFLFAFCFFQRFLCKLIWMSKVSNILQDVTVWRRNIRILFSHHVEDIYFWQDYLVWKGFHQ